jgi:hypothetical protein
MHPSVRNGGEALRSTTSQPLDVELSPPSLRNVELLPSLPTIGTCSAKKDPYLPPLLPARERLELAASFLGATLHQLGGCKVKVCMVLKDVLLPIPELRSSRCKEVGEGCAPLRWCSSTTTLRPPLPLLHYLGLRRSRVARGVHLHTGP